MLRFVGRFEIHCFTEEMCLNKYSNNNIVNDDDNIINNIFVISIFYFMMMLILLKFFESMRTLKILLSNLLNYKIIIH